MARPKINAMLRVSHLYSTQDMLQQFKTHVWGYFEYAHGSIFHATDTQLQKIENLQLRFLRHIGIDYETAFLEFNFAPTFLRRDIAMLGFVQKRILNDCHPKLKELLPIREYDRWDYHTHPIDVDLDSINSRREIFFRSIFGSALLYNRLSQSIVDEKTVPNFQTRLNKIAKARCAAGERNWAFTFHTIEFLLTARPQFEIQET